MSTSKVFGRLAWLATALALGVVVLGAWVRLTGAGLGCPDWPGCYGQVAAPASAAEIAAANAEFPARPVEYGKALREMIHRYFAGTLGLLVFALAALAVARRREPGQAVKLPLALAVLIVFQALLGMWTVTSLLKPLVVMAHLLGGMGTLALLAWLALDSRAQPGAPQPVRWRAAAAVALTVTGAQIALGGWTSTNYAALACPDFPTCQASWWPAADFREAFVMWRGLGIDYEGGVLADPARVAIHLTHRIGAVVTALLVGAVAISAFLRGATPATRRSGALVALFLAAQIGIGISVVLWGLPLGLAVAHNGTAAALLLGVVALNFAVWRSPRRLTGT